MSTNPYDSPIADNDDDAAETKPVSGRLLSVEATGNLKLTSNLLKLAVGFSAVIFAFSAYQTWHLRYALDFSKGWSMWQTLLAMRTCFAPTWLLLAWMMWQYARCLDRTCKVGEMQIETVVEHQARVWLVVGLMICLFLIGIAVTWGWAATIASSTQ